MTASGKVEQAASDLNSIVDGMSSGPVIRPIEPGDSLEELTRLLHRAYAPLGKLGLNYTAVDQSRYGRLRPSNCL